MATRVYLQNASAPITPSAWATGWGTPVTGNVTCAGSVSKGSTAFATVAAASSGSVSTLPFMRFVFGPIGANTFTGQTMKGQMRGKESNAAAQCSIAIAVRVLQPDGTERAVLHAPTYATTVDANPPEFRTATTNNKFRDGNTNAYLDLTGSSQDGDYLCIEIGNRKNAASTSRTITLEYGDYDASNDLPEDDTTTSQYCPWVEFDFDLNLGVTTKTGSDTISLSVSETKTLQSFLERTDTIGLSITDVSQLISLLTGTDTLDLSLTELQAQIINSLNRTDQLDLTLTDVRDSLESESTRTDQLDLTLAEAKDLFSTSERTDTISLTISEGEGGNGSFDRQIAASTDDAGQAETATTCATGNTTIMMGTGDSTLPRKRCSAFRFTNLTIPPGATISTATLQVRKHGDDWSLISGTWYGHDHDDAPAFENGVTDLDALTRTTASVACAENANRIGGQWYSLPTSSDLKTIIQEIVDRGGWASGHALALIFRGDSASDWAQASFDAYDEGTSYGAQLHVEYTAEGSTAQISVVLEKTDTISLSVTEAVAAFQTFLNRVDQLDLSLTEASAFLKFITATDTLNLTLNEAKDLLVTLARADTLNLAATEGTSNIAAVLAATDTLNLTTTEAATILGFLNRIDSLNLSITESSVRQIIGGGVTVNDLLLLLLKAGGN